MADYVHIPVAELEGFVARIFAAMNNMHLLDAQSGRVL